MSRKFNKKSFMIVVSVLAIAGALGSAWLTSWASQSAREAIEVQAESTEPQAAPSEQAVETKFYTTKFPGTFRVQTAENPAKPEQAQTLLFDAAGSGKQVGITTNVLPGDGLAGVGDYTYRMHTASSYKPLVSETFPEGAQAFQKNDGHEMTVFLTKDNRYASITVSGEAIATSQLLTLLGAATENWQWKTL